MKILKTLFTLLPVLSLFPAVAFAQSWSVGLHFGENISTLTGDQNYDYRLGFMGGVQVSHYLTENIVMRLEANLERKGARGQQQVPEPLPGEPDFGNDLRLDYLSLPLLLRYSTGSRSKFIAGGGLSFDYLLREQTDYPQGSVFETTNFRRFDTDLIACLGGAIPLSEKITFTMEVRGMWGLLKVDKPDRVAREFGRNVSWGLMAGLNYYL
jgi:hypothetical protein